jgi:hypothetical protein
MMFRAKLIMLLGLILACGGCSKPTHQKITLDKETVITLQVTTCHRGCSPFTVAINADGTVVFEGSKYVYDSQTGKETSQPLGTHTTKISREQLEQLVSEFDRIDYFNLKDKYTDQKDCPSYGTDAPTVITSLKTNGRSKSISRYGGCNGTDELRDLSALEEKISEIANTKQWLK